MKELTLNEFEYNSGGFNLLVAASRFASFVSKTGDGYTSFQLTTDTAYATFLADSDIAFGYYLTAK
ncbi:hypothetical protein [Klebsiella pneumoniae]|uniref:hypothetical protein n=1 Tax=Klebsiella pneumoniae TaxID=573 RepID=UPI0027308764|nr:hypothetical protein [Klebsiella pneumoniae]